MSASHPNYIISRMGVDVPLVLISLIPTDVGLATPRLCPFLPPNPTHRDMQGDKLQFCYAQLGRQSQCSDTLINSQPVLNFHEIHRGERLLSFQQKDYGQSKKKPRPFLFSYIIIDHIDQLVWPNNCL